MAGGWWRRRNACVWEVNQELRDVQVRLQDHGFAVSVPEDVQEGDHVWLRIPMEPLGELYLDFVVVR